MTAAPPAPWRLAALAAAALAVDPAALGGAVLRGPPGPVRERWLALLREALPRDTPWRRVPLHVTDDRLLGGLDLAATLNSGRPVAARGLLAESDGGVLLLASAERVTAATAGRLAAAMDAARQGLAILALDEGMADDERPPAALLDRLAFSLDLSAIGWRSELAPAYAAAAVAAARDLAPRVVVDEETVTALCGVALQVGIASLRPPLLALRVARVLAALEGRTEVAQEDAAAAVQLVLAPRATCLPAEDAQAESESPPEEDDGPQDADPQDADAKDEGEDSDAEAGAALPEDVMLAAVAAALPPDLLARLKAAAPPRAAGGGRAGALRQARQRGRPTGTRRGSLGNGARLNLVETLRAAAPWQPLRRVDAARRVQVRRDDFRITRFKQRSQTATLFVVDASGSSALHRLAEAKGAVELLLAESYVRRDEVALIAFRGQTAELLLPPTRALARAKRALAGLPGGGGTPLAAGLEAAVALAEAMRRKGRTPSVVLLTDGRANVARDGRGGRERAAADAETAARRLRAAGIAALLVDTSPRAASEAEALAAAMGARYLALPQADARRLSQAVRAAVS